MKIRLVIWILILAYANQCFAWGAFLLLNPSTGHYYWSFDYMSLEQRMEAEAAGRLLSTIGGSEDHPPNETIRAMNQICEEVNLIVDAEAIVAAGVTAEEFFANYITGLFTGISIYLPSIFTFQEKIENIKKEEKTPEDKPADPDNTPVDEKAIEEKDLSELMNAPTETVLHPLSFIKYLPLWLALYNHLGLAIMGTYLLTHAYKIYKEEKYIHSEEYELDRLNKISEYYWGKSGK